MEATCTIQRFNPETDERPHYVDYRIDVPDGTTILDLLHAIKDQQDGSLTFRRSCRSAICGSCAMKVNGVTIMVCKTQVQDAYIKGKLVIEPMGNFTIIKDLVVDLRFFWDKIHAVRPYLAERYSADAAKPYNRMTPEVVDSLKSLADCMFCGACYSDCEAIRVNRNFTGPAALTKAYRFAIDPRDRMGTDRAIELADSEGDGMWLCVICQNCQDHCPQGVRTIEAMDGLKNLATMSGQGAQGFTAAVDLLWKQANLYEVGEFENKMRTKRGLPERTHNNADMRRILKLTGLVQAAKPALLEGAPAPTTPKGGDS